MRKILLYFPLFMFLVSCNFSQNAKLRKELDKDSELKKSYNLGKRVAMGLALNLKEDNKRQAFVLGLQDGLKEAESSQSKKTTKKIRK